MVSIRKLNLSHNSLTRFPVENIDTLSSLHELDLSDNKIISFPAELEHIHLQNLNLSDNQIIDLPALSIRNVSVFASMT